MHLLRREGDAIGALLTPQYYRVPNPFYEDHYFQTPGEANDPTTLMVSCHPIWMFWIAAARKELKAEGKEWA